jgi:hypothetical protein
MLFKNKTELKKLVWPTIASCSYRLSWQSAIKWLPRLLVYLMTLFNCIGYITTKWRIFVNGELERMRNEKSVAFHKVKGKVVPVLNSAPRHEDVLGIGGISPLTFNLSTRWRWVISFTRRSLCPQGKSPISHWRGGWVGPRDRLDAVTNPDLPARSLVAMPTDLKVAFKYIPRGTKGIH